MSMQVHKLTTYLRPEDACTIIEFLDQLRDLLMQAYGDEIKASLQEASRHNPIRRSGMMMSRFSG